MLNPVKFANSTAIVFVAYFVILLIIAAIIPSFADIAPGYGGYGLDGEAINWGYLIIGLVIAAAIIWILVYATISLYNKML